MSGTDTQTRHQTLSYWAGATVVVTYLKRTSDIESCLPNPYFPMARAILLDVLMADKLIPEEKRKEVA